MGSPQIVGLAEVENGYVLDELCNGTPLRKLNYGYIHYDSPDRRGIDCALLYRKDEVKVFAATPIVCSDTAIQYYTRDMLLIGAVVNDRDSLYVVVCHLPSKLGGELAEEQRRRILGMLRYTLDTISQSHPGVTVVGMGDFNADPSEPSFREALGFVDGDTNREGFKNLMYALDDCMGTHNYGGNWSYLDQVIIKTKFAYKVQVFKEDFLLEADERNLTQRPKRTYRGMKYIGGYSDHLPVVLDLKEK